MNKTILFCVVSALTVMNLAALDITTRDGKVYKNVTITNVMPDAIGFMYTKKNFTPVLRDIQLSLLTKDLQKKFNYSPVKAINFKKQVATFQEGRAKLAKKHHLEDLALFRKHKKISRELDHIKAMLHAHRLKCWVHIVRFIGQDCIAKIDLPYSSGKFGHWGTVFIRNLTGPQNERIATTIYPTGKTKTLQDGIFPVYDANLTKYALRILKEKENPSSGDSSGTTSSNLVFPANAPKKK